MADLIIIAGNQEQITFPVQNIANGVTITGATFTLKRRTQDPDPGVLQKTLGSGIVENPANTLLVQLVEADTSWMWLEDRGFFYDCQAILSDGSGPFTVALGRLRARMRVTQTP